MNRPHTHSLEHMIALITGAGRGIGRALAMAMARRGAQTVVVSRTGEEVERVADEIRESGGKAMPYVVDVGQWDQVWRMVREVVNDLGPIDLLVNNAGVVVPVGPFYRVDPVQWGHTIDTNLLGAVFCTRAVVEHMIPRRTGRILSIVSGMGQRVFPGFSAYSVSKAGLIHFTRIVAEEVREYGILVTALDPGLVDTSMHEQLRAMAPEDVGHDMHARLIGYKNQGLLKSPGLVGEMILEFLTRSCMEVTGEIIGLGEFQRTYNEGV